MRIEIDGSQGEGGGQVLRTSLALSAVTGQPVRIRNIRAGRAKPGLLRQHLTGAMAIHEICRGTLEGAALGSTDLTFRPDAIRPDGYAFAVGSAGSAHLVLQTVLPPLIMSGGPSMVVIEGGTHNDASPPFHFLEASFLPLLARMGVDARLTLDRWGFYPAGGGRIQADISGSKPRPIELVERDEPVLTAYAAVSRLPRKIAEREVHELARALGLPRERTRVLEVDSPGPGNVCWVKAEAGPVTEVFTGFGKKDTSAEGVAAAVARDVKQWLARGAPVGEHLADQLLIPMALAGGGRFRTGPPSLHTLTNMAVIERFLPVRFRSEADGERWTIAVEAA